MNVVNFKEIIYGKYLESFLANYKCYYGIHYY